MIKKINENWGCISLHTWLIMSSYGIIFALLSFFEDMGCLNDIKSEHPWIKGVLSIILGLLFYVIIGLPHLNGAKDR
jgi:hypothetical protein